MSVLQQAYEAAEARKRATFGSCNECGEPLSFVEGDESQAAMVFSGFDIDAEELQQVISRASWFFTQRAAQVGLVDVFQTCWTDAFLLGLMVGQQACSPHPPTAGESRSSPAEGE